MNCDPLNETETGLLLKTAKLLDKETSSRIARLVLERDALKAYYLLPIQIVETLIASFPEDPSQPSLVLSKLKDGRWYGSLVRYAEAFGKGKQVLGNTAEDSMADVLDSLATILGVVTTLEVKADELSDGAVRSDASVDPEGGSSADDERPGEPPKATDA